MSAYVKERDGVKLVAKEKRHRLEVTPSVALDKRLFHEPLTLVVEASVVEAVQDGRRLSVERRGGKSIFEFDPQGGKVIIYKEKN